MLTAVSIFSASSGEKLARNDDCLDYVEERTDLMHLHSNIVTRESEVRHAHPRDSAISFEEIHHKYYLQYQRQKIEFPVSVSGIWSRYFAKFDAASILEAYFKSWAANPFHKYSDRIQTLRALGTPDDVIKTHIQKTWTDAGLVASRLGTRMHREIDMHSEDLCFRASCQK